MLEKSVWKEVMPASLNRQNVQHLPHVANKVLRKGRLIESFPF